MWKKRKKKIHAESFMTDGFPDLELIFQGAHLKEGVLRARIFEGEKLSSEVVEIIDQHKWCKECNKRREQLEAEKRAVKEPEDQLLPLEN